MWWIKDKCRIFRYHLLWGLNNWVLKYINPREYRREVHWHWYGENFFSGWKRNRGKGYPLWCKYLKLTCPEKPKGVVDDFTKLQRASFKNHSKKDRELKREAKTCLFPHPGAE